MTSALSDALAGKTRIAFDTNAVIYYLEDIYPYGTHAAQAFSLLTSGAAVGFVSTMVEMETLVRPLRIRDRGLLFSIRRFFALHPNLHVTPMSSEIAEAAAQVRASTSLKAPDAIIAATAAADRCDVIIGNDRAFARNCDLPYLVLDDSPSEEKRRTRWPLRQCSRRYGTRTWCARRRASPPCSTSTCTSSTRSRRPRRSTACG